MAVSKRVRFEVLRRDGFRCHYCGLVAAETGDGLTIDHVIPVALGGTDAPVNLVAACRDCNSGKTSTTAEDQLVPAAASVESQSLAVEARRAALRDQMERLEDVASEFDAMWSRWHLGDNESAKVDRPADWRASVFDLYVVGAPMELFKFAVDLAMVRADRSYGRFAEFRYALAIVRNKLDATSLDFTLTPFSVRTYTQLDMDTEYDRAFIEGVKFGRGTGGAA